MRFLHRKSSQAPVGLALALAALAVAAGLTAPAAWPDDAVSVATVGRAAARPADLPRELDVLLAWDRSRAAAWARSDAAALRRLYLPGSATGRADVRMLRAYAARALRLRGLATQVLGCDLVRGSPGRMRLLVTDRVVGGEVVGRDAVTALPRDRASRREITFARLDGRWVVVEVRTPARRG